MKNKSFWIIALLIVITLTACFSGWHGDEGTITISLGGVGNGRSVYFKPEGNDDPIHRYLNYKIISNGEQIGETLKTDSKNTITAKVPVGSYVIKVEAYLDLKYYKDIYGSDIEYDDFEYYAVSKPVIVDVTAGQNSGIPVTMILICQSCLEKPCDECGCKTCSKYCGCDDCDDLCFCNGNCSEEFYGNEFMVCCVKKWNKAVAQIKSNGNGTENSYRQYTIEVKNGMNSFNMPCSETNTFGDVKFIEIKISGYMESSSTYPPASGSLLNVGTYQTVILDGGFSLHQHNTNIDNYVVSIVGPNAVVRTVKNCNIFGGAGLDHTKFLGSGVYIGNGGTLIMESGRIHSFKGKSGGGVHVDNGTLFIEDGAIAGEFGFFPPDKDWGLFLNEADNGAALYVSGGKAKYGKYNDPATWNEIPTSNGGRNDSIIVEDGELVDHIVVADADEWRIACTTTQYSSSKRYIEITNSFSITTGSTGADTIYSDIKDISIYRSNRADYQGKNFSITLSGNGSILNIGFSGEQNVVIQNIELIGNNKNNYPLVSLSEGAFTMRGNSSISSNSNIDASQGRGGGVFVGAGSTFTMQDNAKIFGNTANIGGGVYVSKDGKIEGVIDAGNVYGNTADISSNVHEEK